MNGWSSSRTSRVIVSESREHVHLYAERRKEAKNLEIKQKDLLISEIYKRLVGLLKYLVLKGQ